jgi:hypothetical protein
VCDLVSHERLHRGADGPPSKCLPLRLMYLCRGGFGSKGCMAGEGGWGRGGGLKSGARDCSSVSGGSGRVTGETEERQWGDGGGEL